MAYEFQVISSVIADILHDVAVSHPVRDHRELPILEGVRNTYKIEDVGMGQVFPQDNFFTEALYGV